MCGFGSLSLAEKIHVDDLKQLICCGYFLVLVILVFAKLMIKGTSLFSRTSYLEFVVFKMQTCLTSLSSRVRY